MLSVRAALISFVIVAGACAAPLCIAPLNAQEVSGPSGTTPLTIEAIWRRRWWTGLIGFC